MLATISAIASPASTSPYCVQYQEQAVDPGVFSIATSCGITCSYFVVLFCGGRMIAFICPITVRQCILPLDSIRSSFRVLLLHRFSFSLFISVCSPCLQPAVQNRPCHHFSYEPLHTDTFFLEYAIYYCLIRRKNSVLKNRGTSLNDCCLHYLMSKSVSRVLSWIIIYLGHTFLHGSSHLPGTGGPPTRPSAVLLRVGFT